MAWTAATGLAPGRLAALARAGALGAIEVCALGAIGAGAGLRTGAGDAAHVRRLLRLG